jgi:Family of unknown function (DUF5681)
MENPKKSGRPITQKQRNGRGSNSRSLQNLKPFRPGQSGHPGGLPEGVPKVSVALMNLLREDARSNYQPKTRAEQLAWAIYQKAIKGDVPALREILDRCEGRTAQKLSIDQDINARERARQVRFLSHTIKRTYEELEGKVTVEEIWTVVEAREHDVFGESVGHLRPAVFAALGHR